MDDAIRAYFEQSFRIAFLESKGIEYQNLFSDIMAKCHPADFIRVRPWGKSGDRKNDGYLRSERTLFQVYAPNELTANDAIRKIDEDFRGALPYWKAHFDRWVFVHNSRQGIGPDITAKLLELDDAYGPEVTQWGFEELRQKVFELAAEDLASLFGPVPTSGSMSQPVVAVVGTDTTDRHRDMSISMGDHQMIIGLDSTNLIAADSFLAPPGKLQDPEARAAFEFATTVYCGEKQLFFSKSEARPDDPSPLLSLWYSSEEIGGQLQDVAISTEIEGTILTGLARKFTQLLCAAPSPFLKWVKFQLMNERLSCLFWSGGNRSESLETARTYLDLDAIVSSGRVFQTAWQEHQPVLRGRFDSVAKQFQSPVGFCLSYAFLAFAKGHLYARAIPEDVVYHCHWIRRGALPEGHQECDRTPAVFPRQLVPWGQILALLRGANLPVFQDEVRFTAALQRLRALTLAFAPIGLAPLVDEDPNCFRFFVKEALRSSEIFLSSVHVSDTAFSALLDDSMSNGDVWTPAIESVTFTIPGKTAHLRYKRTSRALDELIDQVILERRAKSGG